MLDRLVENALEFLSKAISEIKESPKFSVIHFCAAVELFIKARLMSEHWSLIVSKRQDPDWNKLVSGDFHSVTLKEAADKLTKVVRSGLSKTELEAFVEIAKHRNKMVHFFHEAHSDKENQAIRKSISTQQLRAWYYLHGLLKNKWKDVFEPWSKQIEKKDKALRNYYAFLEVVYENIKSKINMRSKQGSIFEQCPSCFFESQEHLDIEDELYESNCFVCELTEKHFKTECSECGEIVTFRNEGFSTCDSCGKTYEPKYIVDVLYDEAVDYIAIKDGGEPEAIGNCSNCDSYHTVVLLENGAYFCANCFDEFASMNCCNWCNELNTGDMENSYWSGCSECEGTSSSW